jgi:hypothetical protein
MAGRISYYGNIVKDGLILNLDAAKKDSYPGSGTVWNDISGNNNNATLINTPTYSTLGGGSILFNGTNSYATGSIQNSSTFTINIWARNINNTIGGSFISTGTSPSTSTNSYIQIGGGVRPFQFNGANLDFTAATTNQWVMLTGVQLNTTQQLYINGASIRTVNVVSILGDYYNIGRRTDGVYLNTYISTAQIYNRDLSASEVLQNYNSLKSRFGL